MQFHTLEIFDEQVIQTYESDNRKQHFDQTGPQLLANFLSAKFVVYEKFYCVLKSHLIFHSSFRILK